MESPLYIKDVQKLMGRVTALDRFISKSRDKCLPFFKTSKKLKYFVSTYESQAALEELKEYMEKAPLLAKPNTNEILYLYLVVSEQTLSAVLVKEEAKIHKNVYYVSKVLHGDQLNYFVIEKFALAFVMASRKLRVYF